MKSPGRSAYHCVCNGLLSFEREVKFILFLKVVFHASPCPPWLALWASSHEYSSVGLAPFPWPGNMACHRPAACFQHVPISYEDCPPTGTPGMDHFKEMVPSAYSFLKLFSLATRWFIRKGISKYCVLYCR